MSRLRRRASPARRYSLAYLLERQPKSLAKHPHYGLMLEYYRNSEALRGLRVSRRCYSLLQHARIAPENLHHFYRTYRLPADPFFPLFFEIKRAYLRDRERVREARRRYILETMRALPGPVLDFIKYLGRLEQQYSGGRRYPVWQAHLFPSTKKQADAYRRFDRLEWIETFGSHLEELEARYRGFNPQIRARLLACFVLEIPLEGLPARRPTHAQVTAHYRRLSMRHHPDRGGDARMFVELQRARDVLVGRG
ncbi:MAG: hypothetical protein ACOC4A_00315 [Spirochaetota bacterium]